MAQKKNTANQATIRDHQAALQEAENALPPVVVVAGDCDYLRTRATAELRTAWLAANPDGDIVAFRGAGDQRPAGIADITRELSGGSLFAKDKLVFVRAADRILFPGNAATATTPAVTGDTDAADARDGAVKAKDREAAFLACVEKPAGRTWLILETGSLPRNRTLGKRLAELAHVIPCPQPTQRELAPWLAGQARKDGAPVDDDAVEMLLRAHGADIGVLAAELDKLVLFAGAGQRITAAMVGEFLTGTIEFDIFGFTNAVEARNAAEAVFYARRIATQGARDQKGKRESADTSAHKVLAILAGTLENLLRAKMAKARRADAEEFARSAGLSPWRARKLMEASGKFSARELRQMVTFAADQIRSTHDTGGDVMLSLETMAVSFTAAPVGAT